MTLSFNSHELETLEHAAGLVLAGYVAAGQPETLHALYIRAERWPERRRLVLQANGRPANLTKLDPTDE